MEGVDCSKEAEREDYQVARIETLDFMGYQTN
jgi:hypothetical protein